MKSVSWRVNFTEWPRRCSEREKTVETQKDRLQDQNRLLREMGSLNENVLNSIDSILLGDDFRGASRRSIPSHSDGSDAGWRARIQSRRGNPPGRLGETQTVDSKKTHELPQTPRKSNP